MKNAGHLIRDYLGGLGALLVSALIFSAVALTQVWAAAVDAPNALPHSPEAKIQASPVLKDYGRLPLSFIENRGQVDRKIRYYEKSGGRGIWFTREAIGLTLYPDREAATPPGSPGPPKGNKAARASSIRLVPVGMRPEVRPEALEPREGRVSYFIGKNPENWRTDIPTYRAVIYREAYPGIDLKFYGTGRQLEYDVIIRPGADPGKVKFRYAGVQKITVTREGDLAVRLPGGRELVQRKPVVYQEIEGARVLREGKFRLLADHTYGFQVAAYDRNHPLVIDPVQFIPSHLIYSTYLGGADIDYGRAIAVDSSGNAYIVGTTKSADFPHDPLSTYHGGGGDVFVTKLNAAGTALIYSVFLGGSDYDEGFGGISVDSSGCAYVAGTTYSDNFPMKNALQGTKGAGGDAFVAKLNPAGNDLVYSTFLGGNGNDYGYGLALDTGGEAYVTGMTQSSNFPAQNAFQATLWGTSDAFVARINAAGSALVYSTYLGGSDIDSGHGIAVDQSGNAYVTGETKSSNFPHYPTQGLKGGSDAFLTKISPAGALVFSSLFGGSSDDVGWAIAVDLLGDMPTVVGQTSSSDFPTQNPVRTYKGSSDAFVTQLNGDGTSLNFSTYLGGGDYDRAYGVALNGDIYVTGETRSADFPLVNSLQTQIYQGVAAFVTKISSGQLLFSTLLGGALGYGIAVRELNAFVTGQAFPDFPTKNPIQATHKGNGDAFVAKLARHPSILKGLVAFYPFDGNAQDASGSGRHATVHGATLVPGYQGQAYYFNGASAYLEAPVDINPGHYPELTMGAWAMPDSPDPRQVLLSHDDGGYDRTLCIDERGDGGWSIFTGSGVIGLGGMLPVDTAKWTLLAARYSKKWAACTLTGCYTYNQRATIASGFGGNPGAGQNTLRIGAHPWDWDFFHGRLDNVFIFNRILTDDELDFILEMGAEAILSASRAGGANLGALKLLLLD